MLNSLLRINTQCKELKCHTVFVLYADEAPSACVHENVTNAVSGVAGAFHNTWWEAIGEVLNTAFVHAAAWACRATLPASLRGSRVPAVVCRQAFTGVVTRYEPHLMTYSSPFVTYVTTWFADLEILKATCMWCWHGGHKVQRSLPGLPYRV